MKIIYANSYCGQKTFYDKDYKNRYGRKISPGFDRIETLTIEDAIKYINTEIEYREKKIQELKEDLYWIKINCFAS